MTDIVPFWSDIWELQLVFWVYLRTKGGSQDELPDTACEPIYWCNNLISTISQ